MRTSTLAFIGAALLAGPACSDSDVHQSQHHAFRTVAVAEGLEHPWSVAFLPGGKMLVTERPGRLRLVRDGELAAEPVRGVPDVAADNQGGLLDVVLHPDFADNAFVYLTYAAECPGGATTAVGRGTWADGALQDFTELYRADACGPGGRHHGSRLVFDRDGYLFMTVGERGDPPRAQDPTDNAGATLRLNGDGTVPDDNPFVGEAGHDANWTWGNRNPQGMAVHPATGEIWQNEHGPRGGDEINVVRRGANYGWPDVGHGADYRTREPLGVPEREDVEPPLLQWTPSIAPSGMTVYDGDAFPGWRHDVFSGALAHEHLARVRFDGREPVERERLLEGVGRVRDVRTGPDGLIYLLTDAADGALLRLEPVAADDDPG